jgi:hypothetical protein
VTGTRSASSPSSPRSPTRCTASASAKTCATAPCSAPPPPRTPSPDIVELARDTDLFIAEATCAEEVPADSAQHLSSARQAGRYAGQADIGRLLLTRLWPGSDPQAAVDAARRAYGGDIGIAAGGLVLTL